MLYWFLKTILIGPLVRVIFRPWTEGTEHIPQTGGVIFASNHLSFSDSIFLPLMVPRRMTFPAKMEYFTGTGVKGWLTKSFFTGVGQIPIDRSGGQASMAALNSGLRVLRRGEVFGIYPEGTRSPDGRLYKGKTGVARLALEAGVPVIPVAMIGTDKAQPTGRVIPTLHRVGIRFGAPLDFSRYDGMAEDRYVLRSITDEIMYELMHLSGQEYVDEYASTAKERIAAAARGAVDQARAGLEQAKGQVEQAAGHVVGQVRGGVDQVLGHVESVREQVGQVRGGGQSPESDESDQAAEPTDTAEPIATAEHPNTAVPTEPAPAARDGDVDSDGR